jgi:spermidine synthase
MNNWTVIGKAKIPGSDNLLKLARRDDEFSIRIVGVPGDLMNSRVFNSEQALAELACGRLQSMENSRVLVGGLGMGFTLAAALKSVTATAEVTVAELIPEVLEWNKSALGACAGNPLQDARTRVHLGDVAQLLRPNGDNNSGFDAILLDVDNGPAAMTHLDNEQLYSRKGLAHIFDRLRPEGILAVWSAQADQLFTIRLRKTGFKVSVKTVRARVGKGSRHTIFLAQKPWKAV